MARLIKYFSDESRLEFDRGNFDEWCIFLTRPGRARFAPKDWQYFTRLQQLAAVYGSRKVYADFALVFDATDRTLNPELLAHITALSNDYMSCLNTS